MKNSTLLCGNNSLNSPYSWAARVLLCTSIIAGLCDFWITLAMVNVLPVPVAPKRTCHFLSSNRPFTRLSIALGWSPVGLNGACKLKGWLKSIYYAFLSADIITCYLINIMLP